MRKKESKTDRRNGEKQRRAGRKAKRYGMNPLWSSLKHYGRVTRPVQG